MLLRVKQKNIRTGHFDLFQKSFNQRHDTSTTFREEYE